MSCSGGDNKSANCAENGSSATNVIDNVKEYYGKTLQSTGDLQTGACQLGGPKMPSHVRSAINDVHDEVRNRYFGCGLSIPDHLTDCRILDLGSGAGLDCFVLSRLVGEKGHVTGIDMTDEQLDVARKHVDYHMKKYGYRTPNTDFVQGYIEKLREAGFKENHYDIIVSNCVVNLSPDKKAVLASAYSVLKEGGELYFSDLYADQRVPENMRGDKVLWGEGIAGALWWEDLHAIAKEVGFSPPRLVTANMFDISKPELVEAIGDLKFVAATYRLFKVPSGESTPCGAEYEGTIDHCESEIVLDHKTKFKTGDPVTVGKEVASILNSSRFSEHFNFQTLAKIAHQEENLARDNPFDLARTSPSVTCSAP